MAKEKNSNQLLTENINYGNIIDPNRDPGELVDKKLTPTTIKALLGKLDKNSQEFKTLQKRYHDEVAGTKKPGVIRLNNASHWEKARTKSQFINRDYQNDYKEKTEAKLGLLVKKPGKNLKTISTVSANETIKLLEKTAKVKENLNPKPVKIKSVVKPKTDKKTLETNLIKPPVQAEKDLNTELARQGKQEVNSNYNEMWKTNFTSKNKGEVKKENDEIQRQYRPVLATQLSQIKRNGLSIVDFIIEPDDKIEIEKKEDEILVHLIKDHKIEIEFDEFFAKPEVIEKPTPVKVIRKEQKRLTLEEHMLKRLESKAKVDQLELLELQQLKNLRQILGIKEGDFETQREMTRSLQTELIAEISEMELPDAEIYKQTDYNYVFDAEKRPNVTKNKKETFEQQILNYLLTVQEQYEQGYNRQISQELADFNQAINQTKSLLFNSDIIENHKRANTLLRLYVKLLNRKQQLELLILNRHLLKNTEFRADMEGFVRSQKEFQKLLILQETIKDTRQQLIELLREQTQLANKFRQENKK
ncbi:hypothetical protein [Spiroplasma chrysopicola]|uniref:Uncharacterized protein n=1 Tax=Spiroplasma chrysopicola DF-1 TaxID=1276227 RepID=R4UG44_9MOLU|nr:hypothetical protein [Spiroplasma chrysopicola]AGM25110.1 hypothetical protein SCHRY_v1c05320 [Spiroplasma chrysopicola DF-1]